MNESNSKHNKSNFKYLKLFFLLNGSSCRRSDEGRSFELVYSYTILLPQFKVEYCFQGNFVTEFITQSYFILIGVLLSQEDMIKD
ncbi:CLUMA_CG007638, isoform A [Clunio marinus]|uniref:CLUMA_CG007638, isoform A n=1 Tax=Clunio marinus TaxID=568069 RepID=A0A1J1I1M5_9DIPT|nr:CLUMA_CG007638, isoform A [Clunio marinus]